MTERRNLPTISLLHEWHRGDRAALDELIERNLDWVRTHVRHRLGPELRARAETLDFVQEAMLEFLEYGPRFEVADDARFRALLVRVVENNLRDERKRLRRQRRDAAREKAVASDTVLKLDPPARSVSSPSMIADRAERHAWIRLALEFLDAPDREIIVLRDFEERTFTEIATQLEIGENGARMRYNRALPKLARKVQELRERGLPAATPE